MTIDAEHQTVVAFPHRRPFALVHDRLPYSAIVDRRPIEWPDGRMVAVWVAPNIEHYEYLPPAGAADPYPRTPHPDVRKASYHDYGNRVGFWRLLAAVDRYGIACTASLNVAVLDHYPEVAAAMRERAWDLMSHGLYNTRFLTGLGPDDEREFLRSCDRALARHVGHGFSGMLGPFISATPSTPDVMAELGMSFHADWVHDERPSPLATSIGSLVALPYSYELNDAPILMRSSAEGGEYLSRCVANVDRLRAEAARSGGRMMCLPLHPFAIGMPHRIGYLERLFEHLRSVDDVWIATASDIVAHYRTHYLQADLDLLGAPE